MSNEEIFGTDYSSSGEAASNGDILCVSGLDNARQAIKNALLTPKGSYPSVDDEYGSELHTLHGEDISQNQLQAMEVYIRNALLKQERVREIQDIQINATSDGLKAYVHVLLVNGTDDSLSINIGGVE